MARRSDLDPWRARYSLTTCTDLIHHVAMDLDDVRTMKEEDVTRMAAWLGMRSSMAKARRLEDMVADIKAAGHSQLVVAPQASRRLVVRPQPPPGVSERVKLSPRRASRRSWAGERDEDEKDSDDGSERYQDERDSDDESDVKMLASQDDDATVIEPKEERDDATVADEAGEQRADDDEAVPRKMKKAAERLRRAIPAHPFRLVSSKRHGIVVECLVPGCRAKKQRGDAKRGNIDCSGYIRTGNSSAKMKQYWNRHLSGSYHTSCLKALSNARSSGVPLPDVAPNSSKRQRRE